jgi:hypothetical protein
MAEGSAILDRPVSRLRLPVLMIFVWWYLAEHPWKTIRLYLAFAAALLETFSFFFLLRTIFAPWKRITDSYPKSLLNLPAVFETFVFNVVTRGIGAVIRIVTILVGLFLQVILLALFAAYLTLWYVFPFLAFTGIAFLFVQPF